MGKPYHPINSIINKMKVMKVKPNVIPCPNAPKKRHVQVFNYGNNKWNFIKTKPSPMEILKIYRENMNP
jgi:hypothetical protein